MALNLTLTDDEGVVVATWTIGDTREQLEDEMAIGGYEHDAYAAEGFSEVNASLEDVTQEVINYYEREGKV